MEKYLNYFQDSNEKILIGLNEKGKLNRLYFPNRDYFEFIDDFRIGVKINDSQMIFLDDDINNVYSTSYLEKSNIVEIEVLNTYFNVKFKQTIFVDSNENIVWFKIDVLNLSKNDYNINIYINPKLNTSKNNIGASKIFSNGVELFNHEYIFAIFSEEKIASHRLNDIDQNIKNCNIYDKDVCGMSSNVCVNYNLGNIKKECFASFSFGILLMEKTKQKNFDSVISKVIKLDVDEALEKRKICDQKFLDYHDKIRLDKEKTKKRYKRKYSKEEATWRYEYINRIYNIYQRSLFQLKNLLDEQTGAIVAAMEVDENRQKSGMYNFVWPRDSVFVTQALDSMGMTQEVSKFYLKFIKIAQNKDGSFEQRYFCNGTFAPSWGYQIDESASVVYGIYNHYMFTKDLNFLRDAFSICDKTISFLKSYVDDTYNYLIKEDKKEEKEKRDKKGKLKYPLSYDLWEMHEGFSIYSVASIYKAFICQIEMLKKLKKDSKVKIKDVKEQISMLNEYKIKINKILQLFLQEDDFYVRNLEDKQMDISILGLVYPFDLKQAYDSSIVNTVDKINNELKTYTNGYKRFVGDSYLNGIPWPIANLWMANYYMKAGDFDKAKEAFDFVVYSCSDNFMLGEQVDNNTMKPIWVIGLGWSHAMFLTTLDEMVKNKVIEI